MEPHQDHTTLIAGELSKRIDVNRLSFVSLPGEIRNRIYELTLPDDRCLFIEYNMMRRKFISFCGFQRNHFSILKTFSSIDHNIRNEARSMFFKKYTFHILALTEQAESDRTEANLVFLENIGSIGRKFISSVYFYCWDLTFHTPIMGKAIRFWDLIRECHNLETLLFKANFDSFYMRGQIHHHRGTVPSLRHVRSPFQAPWHIIYGTLASLPEFRKLELIPIFRGCPQIHRLLLEAEGSRASKAQSIDTWEAERALERQLHQLFKPYLSDDIYVLICASLVPPIR